MLIICQIDWREVGVAFELQCLRYCTLSSFLCFFLLFLFRYCRNCIHNMRYRNARTILHLELTNHVQSLRFEVAKLLYNANYYRFVVTKQHGMITLKPHWCTYSLDWTRNVHVHNLALDCSVVFSSVQITTFAARQVRDMLRPQHSALLHIKSASEEFLDIVVLYNGLSEGSAGEPSQSNLYPILPAY